MPHREPTPRADLPSWFRGWLVVMRLLWWGFCLAAAWRLADLVLTGR